jgi:molecular chaperone Hsp31 and glyoxalase 3
MGGIVSKLSMTNGTNEDGSRTPSGFVRTFFLNSGATCPDFKRLEWKQKYEGEQKILVICTSQNRLKCANGELFDTGHNVTEMLVTMIHLHDAGFKFDIATADGRPVALEDWTWPPCAEQGYEKDLRELVGFLQEQLDNPLKTEDVQNLNQYIALFIPGGHGCMIDMHNPPDNGATGAILRTFHDEKKTIITLCHGPNALRAAAEEGKEFPFQGYSIACFPDSGDKQSPTVGYLPGQMTEFMCEQLAKYDMKFVNSSADDTTHVDRELITGASPNAAQKLGVISAKTLLGNQELH